MYYIGIDLGTSATKLMLVTEAGEIVNSITKEYPLYFPHPGWSEQNPSDWWSACFEGISELIKGYDANAIAGIGLGGQMHGLVVLDEMDTVIRPAILWMKENEPENFARIKKIMLPKDYINYCLTGVHACDYSDASGMLLLDVEKKAWSKEMLDICGITEAQMP